MDIKQQYDRDGYVILRSALSADELKTLKTEAAAICRGQRGTFPGVEAADPSVTDDEVISNFLCVHFPHKISPVMLDVLKHPAIVDGLTKVIGPNVKAMQSMLFMKASGKPGQAWHQDEYFIPTRDRSLCGVWIALDDATIENGCMWVVPGSHARGVIYPQREHNDERFDFAGEAYGFPEQDADGEPVEMRAGDVLLFHGYLLHRSLPNRAPAGTFRRSIANHYMSAESLLPWGGKPAFGIDDYRDIVLVAGDDPYAWKGTEEVASPHLRAASIEQAQQIARQRQKTAAGAGQMGAAQMDGAPKMG